VGCGVQVEAYYVGHFAECCGFFGFGLGGGVFVVSVSGECELVFCGCWVDGPGCCVVFRASVFIYCQNERRMIRLYDD